MLDTPISESAFIGAAAGAACSGLRPVVELMFVDFMGVCFDQIFNQAAKFRYMFGGKAVTPMVIRTMWGAGIRAASQHSQALYPIFTHIPGLKVVVPSNPYDAKGLLIEAIRDDDPVVFFENKVLYTMEGDVPEEGYTIPFGEANIVREGGDVTIVALGREVGDGAGGGREAGGGRHRVRDHRPAHDVPARRGHDLRVGVETPGAWSWSTRPTRAAASPSDIVARVAQECFGALEAAPQMVTAPHTPVPFSPRPRGPLRPRTPGRIEDAVRAATGERAPA